MGMLDQLMGNLMGGPQRQEYEDFANRYDQGAPWDGISDEEASMRYQQVARQMPPEAYQQSAEQAFARLSPQERMEFVRWMQTRSREQNLQAPGYVYETSPQAYEDPRALAQMTSRLQQEQPDLLGQLFGGGGTNPAAKGVMAGIVATAVKSMFGRS